MKNPRRTRPGVFLGISKRIVPTQRNMRQDDHAWLAMLGTASALGFAAAAAASIAMASLVAAALAMAALVAASLAMAAAVATTLRLATAARSLGFAGRGGSGAARGLVGAAHVATAATVATLVAAALAMAALVAATLTVAAAVAAAGHLFAAAAVAATAAISKVKQIKRKSLGCHTHQAGSQSRHKSTILHWRAPQIGTTRRRKRKQHVAGTAGPAMFTCDAAGRDADVQRPVS
jgi:hypothetical protein